MGAISRLVTASELLEMSDEGDGRLELIEGELFEMPPPSEEHEDVAGNAFSLLCEYVRPRRLGKVHLAPGFIIRTDPDTVRAPDVAFTRGRDFSERSRGYHRKVPDLVLEIVSTHDRHSEVQRKALMWLAAGASRVWVLDPPSRTITVYRSGQALTLLRDTDDIEGGDLIPGFRARVGDFFE